MKLFKHQTRSSLYMLFLCIFITACSSCSATNQSNTVEPETVSALRQDNKEQARQEIINESQSTLENLYKENPSAEQVIDKAAGYAVFSNFGMKLFFAGGGTGHGVAINNGTNQKTFMKMLEVQAGLGFGIKKFQLVFVFGTDDVMNGFINSGWQFGGQTTASFKTQDIGDAYQYAIPVSEGIWLYQITEEGIALELTGKGAKFYTDDELNDG